MARTNCMSFIGGTAKPIRVSNGHTKGRVVTKNSDTDGNTQKGTPEVRVDTK